MKSVRASYVAIFCAVSLVLLGCEPIRVQLPTGGLELEPASVEGEVEIMLANQEATWEATADQPWLQLDPPNGTGSMTMRVIVDEDHPDLRSPGTYMVTVTVTSGDDMQTFTVTFTRPDLTTGLCDGAEPLGDAGPVSTEYLPLEVGNYWQFTPVRFNVGETKGFSSSDDALRIEVTDRFTQNGYQVAELSVSLPFLIELTPFGVPAPDVAFQGFESLAPLARLGFQGAKGELPFTGIPIYLVNAGGDYYFTSDPAFIDSLPCPVGFASLASLFEFPGRVLHAVESGEAEDFAERADLRFDQLADDLAPLSSDIDAYFSVSAFPQNLIELSEGFRAEFRTYEGTSSPLVNNSAQLIAAFSGGVDDTFDLADGFMVISIGVLRDIQNLGGDLNAYLDTVEEEPAPVIDLLRDFAMESEGFSSEDPFVDGVADLNRVIANAFADVIEAVDAEEYSLQDDDLGAFSDAVRSCFFQESFLDTLANDPIGSLDAFIACVTGIQTGGPASAEFKRIVLEVLTVVRNTGDDVLSFESVAFPLEDGGLADLDEIERYTQFLFDSFGDASTQDPDDVLAEYLSLVSQLLDESVEVLLAYRPYASDVLSAVVGLGQSYSLAGPDDHAPALFADMLGEFNVYLSGYAAANADPLAEALGLAADAGADVLNDLDGVIEDLRDVQFAVQDGTLGQFLPAEFPDGAILDSGGFFVEDTTNVQTTLVTLGGTGNSRQIPTTILGSDFGPILLSGAFTVRAASVGGDAFDCSTSVVINGIESKGHSFLSLSTSDPTGAFDIVVGDCPSGLAWEVFSSDAWLTASPSMGSRTSTVTVTVDVNHPQVSESGFYSGFVTVVTPTFVTDIFVDFFQEAGK